MGKVKINNHLSPVDTRAGTELGNNTRSLLLPRFVPVVFEKRGKYFLTLDFLSQLTNKQDCLLLGRPKFFSDSQDVEYEDERVGAELSNIKINYSYNILMIFFVKNR